MCYFCKRKEEEKTHGPAHITFKLPFQLVYATLAIYACSVYLFLSALPLQFLSFIDLGHICTSFLLENFVFHVWLIVLFC